MINPGAPEPPPLTQHFTRRRFRTHRPANRDIVELILFETTWDQSDDGTYHNVVQRVLTEDGWHEYKAYEVLPSNLPHIGGIDTLREQAAINLLDQFEQHIRTLIGEPT